MKLAALKRFRYHALILVGVLIAYVAADVWWHRRGHGWTTRTFGFTGPSVPYFSSPKYPSLKIGDEITWIAGRVFPNFEHRYKRRTSPFRPRPDPQGNEYFPDDFPGGYENIFTTFSYSGLLRCLEEPSIFANREDAPDTFRLTLISSWDSHFSCRTNELKDGSFNCISSACDAQSGGKVRRKSTSLPIEAWTQIDRIISSADFWEELTPAEEGFLESGRDGRSWLFERKSGGEYQAIVLWSPDFLAMMKGGPAAIEAIRDFRPYAEVGGILSEQNAFSTSSRHPLEILKVPNDEEPGPIDPFAAPKH